MSAFDPKRTLAELDESLGRLARYPSDRMLNPCHHLHFPQAPCDRESSCSRLPTEKAIFLEQKYWLKRTKSSLAKAQNATSAEARLIHFDLAGRYSIKAADAGSPSPAAATSEKD